MDGRHCKLTGAVIYVRVGSNQWQSGGQLISGLSAWYHPSFNPTNYNNNIGVIKLTQDATLSKNVTTVKLLPRNLCCGNLMNKAYFSGWGYTSKTAPGVTAKLNFYNTMEISNLQCMNNLLKLKTPSYGLATVGSWIPSSVLCTAAATSPTVLTGDDGGPLIITTGVGKSIYQVGVLSISDFFPVGAPAIFTRVCHYLDILQAHTGIAF